MNLYVGIINLVVCFSNLVCVRLSVKNKSSNLLKAALIVLAILNGFCAIVNLF